MLPGILNPWAGLLFLLLIPLIIFYFLKLRRPRLEIPSLALWQQVMADQRVNSPFQKFRRNFLLLLQILLLCCLAFAAMQPYLAADGERADYLPLLLDTSASMGAVDAQSDTSRLDLAKEEVRQLIDNLLPDQRLCLIAVDSTARRLTDFTNNKRFLHEALDRLTTTQTSSRLDDGLRLVQALARTQSVKKAILYSDGNVPELIDFELPFALDFQKLPAAGPNVGITEFNARRNANGWDVFGRIEGSPTAEGVAEILLLQNGEVLGRQTLARAAGGAVERVVFQVDTQERTSLELRLQPDGFDALASDNRAYLDLPATRPLMVYCPEDYSTFRHALAVTEQVQVFPGKGNIPPQVDLKIARENDDSGPKADVTLFVGSIPAEIANLVHIDEGLAEVVDWQRTAPLLQHVQLQDVQIADVPVLSEGIGDRDFESAGYQILAYSRTGPLILQKNHGGRLAIHLLFQTDRSSLPYRVGFPILVANAVELAWQRSGLAEVRSLPTGVLPVLTTSANATVNVTRPDGSQVTQRATPTGVVSGILALETGRYELSTGGDALASYGVSLLSPSETRLETVEKLLFDETTISGSRDTQITTDRPLWSWFAIIGLVILLVEWWYFQKRPGGVSA